MLAHPALRAVICNSLLVRDEMQRHYDVPASKLVVIENGVDLQNYHPRLAGEWRQRQRQLLGIGPDAPVFLFVGSGFARKGVPQLLAAFAAMRARDAHLVVVGRDRSLAAMKRRANRLGVGRRTIFTGPQQDVRPFYGMADAFVLPTLYDPMPNAALEAMACGLPTIASASCGIAARIVPGRNGFVCDALDVPQLAGQLDRLAVPGVAAGMRAAARDAVAELSLEAMAERLLGLYRSLI